jgi:hypothetical protein
MFFIISSKVFTYILHAGNFRLVWLIEITRNYFWPPKSEINSQQNITKIAKTSKKGNIYIYSQSSFLYTVDNICQCIAAGVSLQNKTTISKQDGNLWLAILSQG